MRLGVELLLARVAGTGATLPLGARRLSAGSAPIACSNAHLVARDGRLEQRIAGKPSRRSGGRRKRTQAQRTTSPHGGKGFNWHARRVARSEERRVGEEG